MKRMMSALWLVIFLASCQKQSFQNITVLSPLANTSSQANNTTQSSISPNPLTKSTITPSPTNTSTQPLNSPTPFTVSTITPSPTITSTQPPKIQIVNEYGNSDIHETDNLTVQINGQSKLNDQNQYVWYRNGIILNNAKGSLLTNKEMKTFRGSEHEYTPASNHQDHTIRGYEFKVEILDEGKLIGSSNIQVGGAQLGVPMHGVAFFNFGNPVFLPTREKIRQSMKNMTTQLNPNWISIGTFYFQDGGNSEKIYPKLIGEPRTVPDEETIDQINYAHELGLKVVLYPQVWLARSDGTGTADSRESAIVPTDAWFESYKQFITHEADIAQDTGVDLFVIGVELQSTQHKTEQWLDVIKKVRDHYKGKITYSPIGCDCAKNGANLSQYSWFSELDYIGISANIEIVRTNDYDPKISYIETQFNKCVTEFKKLSEYFKKQVVILEAGLTVANGMVFGLYSGDFSTFDYQEHADWFEAFFRTFGNQPWIEGIFVLQWLTPLDIYYEEHFSEFYIDSRPNHVYLYFTPSVKVISSWYGNGLESNK